jgi:lysophospholipase L1-like esterase
MASPDVHRRARPVWVGAVLLVALAVAIPVIALVVRDVPQVAEGDRAATTVAASPDSVGAAEPVDSSEEEAAVSARGPVRALFFGDSYFIGGGYTGEENSMARLASNRLGWDSEVRGGGGTGFVTANLEFGLGTYLEQIERGAFDVGPRRWVVIQGGNNDRGAPLADVNRNARKVVRIAQRTFPNAKVVLMGPLDSDGDYAESRPMMKLLRKVARKRGVPFINDMKWLKGHYDLIGPDFVHPYPEGHRLLGRKLAKALRNLGA